jgi:hypothetical protein
MQKKYAARIKERKEEPRGRESKFIYKVRTSEVQDTGGYMYSRSTTHLGRRYGVEWIDIGRFPVHPSPSAWEIDGWNTASWPVGTAVGTAGGTVDSPKSRDQITSVAKPSPYRYSRLQLFP